MINDMHGLVGHGHSISVRHMFLDIQELELIVWYLLAFCQGLRELLDGDRLRNNFFLQKLFVHNQELVKP